MRLSILTTITNPDERQDKWREALACYRGLADEVVVVDGSQFPSSDGILGKLYDGRQKIIYLHWPKEWNWIELPRHLNVGLEEATGDFVLKLDIDQFIHEKDFKAVRDKLERCPEDIDVLTFQKMSMTYGGKYYQKGPVPICFRRKDYIKIGKNLGKKTDLCFPIKVTKYEKVDGYDLPCGTELRTGKAGIQYWNFDYFFKTKRFTKREFWRFSKAYHRYFGEWTFGESSEKAFKKFLDMMKGRHDRAPYAYKLEDHPKYIRGAVENLKKEQFGFDAWGEFDDDDD